MKYVSTRGGSADRRFSEVLMEGLAPDGGLYVPTAYPKVDDATLKHWRGLSYPELAFEILSRYIDDIPAEALRSLIARTYTPEIFGSAQIVPLRTLDESIALLNLSNGPTFAFKDMAMQLLGNLFEAELERRGA
ncbi:MAG: threonine synthase, partial [Trinickia sp.]